MPYNQNDFNLKEQNQHNFNLSINQEQHFNLTLQNQHVFGLNIFGFATSSSIYVKLRHAIKTAIGFLLRSKMHYVSRTNLKTIISYKMFKKYFATASQSVQTHIRFLMINKIKFISKSGIRIGKIGTLNLLDSLLLSNLDGKTLDQLNFIYGVALKMKKKMFSLSKSALTTNINLNMFRYNKLLNYDGLSLSDLDTQTLGSLEKTLIS